MKFCIGVDEHGAGHEGDDDEIKTCPEWFGKSELRTPQRGIPIGECTLPSPHRGVFNFWADSHGNGSLMGTWKSHGVPWAHGHRMGTWESHGSMGIPWVDGAGYTLVSGYTLSSGETTQWESTLVV